MAASFGVTRCGRKQGTRVPMRRISRWGMARRSLQDIFEPGVAEHQRVAARDDDVPDLGVAADVVQAVLDVAGMDLARVADLALPGAEPAVRGAAVRDEKQQPVRIAVDDARHGRILVLAQRVGHPVVLVELGRVGHDLAVDGIAFMLDQARVIGRDLGLEDAGNLANLVRVQAESAAISSGVSQAAP